MEWVCFSETLLPSYKFIRRYHPETHQHQHLHLRANLVFHITDWLLYIRAHGSTSLKQWTQCCVLQFSSHICKLIWVRPIYIRSTAHQLPSRPLKCYLRLKKFPMRILFLYLVTTTRTTRPAHGDLTHHETYEKRRLQAATLLVT